MTALESELRRMRVSLDEAEQSVRHRDDRIKDLSTKVEARRRRVLLMGKIGPTARMISR